VKSKEGSSERTPTRLAVAAGCSAASPDAMATITECFAKQPLIVTNTPLVGIAINNRDPNICS
jgi:hypothetical protein